MDDLISRQAAIEALAGWKISPIVLAPVPSEPQWTPCSERLPDVRHNVLITDGNHTAEGQLQDNGDWMQYRWTCLRKHEEIIAWMPLPEPYKGEES